MSMEPPAPLSPTSPSSLSRRELIYRALRGEPIPRAACGPLAVHYCAHVAGVSLRDYTLSPRTLADCVLRYYETFHPDAVWISADTWVNAQAMGAAVAFPAPDQPLAGTGQPCVRTAADINRIPPPDPASQGRWPLILEALRVVRRALGDDVFIAGCFDQYPFSLACALMGIEPVMTRLLDQPTMIEDLMARCADYAIAYGAALAQAGADMLSGGDSPAGLINPRLYHDVVQPFEQRVIRGLKLHTTVPISLHICGNATPILADMAASGADVLELDHQVDLSNACRLLPPEIAIWGNLDPVGLLAQSTPQQVRAATLRLLQTAAHHQRRRFVVSSGCTLAPDTPAANLHAMFDTVRQAAPPGQASSSFTEKPA